MDLGRVEKLDAGNKGITSLKGLEKIPNLKKLYLNNNKLDSLAPIRTISKLEVLDLSRLTILLEYHSAYKKAASRAIKKPKDKGAKVYHLKEDIKKKAIPIKEYVE